MVDWVLQGCRQTMCHNVRFVEEDPIPQRVSAGAARLERLVLWENSTWDENAKQRVIYCLVAS